MRPVNQPSEGDEALWFTKECALFISTMSERSSEETKGTALHGLSRNEQSLTSNEQEVQGNFKAFARYVHRGKISNVEADLISC